VSGAYYITLLLLSNENYVSSSPPQWPLVPIGGLLGVTGSIIDSFLGATLQYSGKFGILTITITIIII